MRTIADIGQLSCGRNAAPISWYRPEAKDQFSRNN